MQDWNTCLAGGTNQVATLNCLPIVFKNILTAAFIFAGTAALFFIAFSAFKYINSRGDTKKFEDARRALVYAIVGLTVVLLSLFAINIISYITGVDCIRFFGFTNCQ